MVLLFVPDLAVAINDQVELLNSNGTLIGAAMQQFTQLKALAFDSVRHQFVVSDMDQQNDTIYSVQLTKQTDIMPIVEDLLDDIQVRLFSTLFFRNLKKKSCIINKERRWRQMRLIFF